MVQKTIYALSTVYGRSGVAVIRISGKNALESVRFLTNINIQNIKPRNAYYTPLYSVNTKELLDHALLFYFKSPHSFTGEDIVEIHCSSTKVLFKYRNILFQSRLISGNYPPTAKSIPEEFNLVVKANLQELYNVIEQASILTTDKEKNIVSLSTKDNLLTVKSVSNEKGKAEMKMNISKNNDEEITIAFSAKYMMEALNALNTEEIEMSFVGEVKPIVIKNTKDDGLLQLVVPIRTY